MANQSVLGLYGDADTAAEGARQLRDAGFTSDDYEVMTGNPYPEGAFGEHVKKNKLFRFSPFWGLYWLRHSLLLRLRDTDRVPIGDGRQADPRDPGQHDNHV